MTFDPHFPVANLDWLDCKTIMNTYFQLGARRVCTKGQFRFGSMSGWYLKISVRRQAARQQSRGQPVTSSSRVVQLVSAAAKVHVFDVEVKSLDHMVWKNSLIPSLICPPLGNHVLFVFRSKSYNLFIKCQRAKGGKSGVRSNFIWKMDEAKSAMQQYF